MTSPPAPPTTFEQRLWAAEHGLGAVEREQGGITTRLDKIETKLVEFQTQFTVWVTERAVETKSKDRWKNWALGILSGVVLLAFGALATFMSRVQGSKLSP